MKGVCDVSHNSILFSKFTLVVYTFSHECQSIFLTPIGSKRIQHNKEKYVVFVSLNLRCFTELYRP